MTNAVSVENNATHLRSNVSFHVRHTPEIKRIHYCHADQDVPDRVVCFHRKKLKISICTPGITNIFDHHINRVLTIAINKTGFGKFIFQHARLVNIFKCALSNNSLLISDMPGAANALPLNSNINPNKKTMYWFVFTVCYLMNFYRCYA